jgi:CheY-like chemotaxis protein
VMLRTDLNKDQKEYLNAIKESGATLLVIINDILDIAKVDAGKIVFEKIPFNLLQSVSSTVHLLDEKIKEKNLKLVKDYDASLPEIAVGDPVRLRQVLLNLLSNAVKFTSTGSITVSVHKLKEDPEKVTVEFIVTDTGIGIPEDKQEHIFESFEQATDGINRVYGGTGLGLAIVKKFVELQGGTISLQSKPGKGSSFGFVLTFEKTNLIIPDENGTAFKLNTDVKNIKVLVAEDNALNQLLIKIKLTEFGFYVDIADDGNIAIEKLLSAKYDIILMDLHMPEMDGFETTGYIRNIINSDIPIIALTADVTSTDVEKSKAIGMNDYLSKPIDEKLLYSKIMKYVQMD